MAFHALGVAPWILGSRLSPQSPNAFQESSKPTDSQRTDRATGTRLTTGQSSSGCGLHPPVTSGLRNIQLPPTSTQHTSQPVTHPSFHKTFVVISRSRKQSSASLDEPHDLLYPAFPPTSSRPLLFDQRSISHPAHVDIFELGDLPVDSSAPLPFSSHILRHVVHPAPLLNPLSLTFLHRWTPRLRRRPFPPESTLKSNHVLQPTVPELPPCR